MGTGGEPARGRRDGLAGSTVPTLFRLASETMLEREKVDDKENEKPQNPDTDSSFGVESLKSSTCQTPSATMSKILDCEPKEYETSSAVEETVRRRDVQALWRTLGAGDLAVLQNSQKQSEEQISHRSSRKHSRQQSPSQSTTSLSVDSQAPLSSIPSSPKSISIRSLRGSDEDPLDETGSQAVASGSEDDTHPTLRESAPQLIMPSIKMPSRRPFTEKGKLMGRLKILLAGDSGVGKTSMIKSMVQCCEDIVHIDTVSGDGQKPPHAIRPHLGKDKPLSQPTQNITEIYASTRPYPDWWADCEESRLLRKRRSTDDTVLERNICFVDTPGYGQGLSKLQSIESVLQYIKRQLERSFQGPAESDGDVAGLLSGNGGSQVDLVLYMISKDLQQEDLLFLERLTTLTNVITVIAKADLQSAEEVEVLRRSITERTRGVNVKTFVPVVASSKQSTYSVCSVSADDDEVMDASLLMSSEYVQPLVSSELHLLTEHIFQKDTVSCLRHLASKKLVNTSQTVTPLSLTKSARSHSLSSYMQAKVTDHMQQEERMAQIKLAKWASDLRRNLHDERSTYDALAKRERLDWLNDKLDQCTEPQEGSTIAIMASQEGSKALSKSKSRSQFEKGNTYHSKRESVFDFGDPLGLLRWNEAMRRHGWIAFQVAGSFGLLGAVAVWAAKAWGIGAYGCGGSEEERWVWGLFSGGK